MGDEVSVDTGWEAGEVLSSDWVDRLRVKCIVYIMCFTMWGILVQRLSGYASGITVCGYATKITVCGYATRITVCGYATRITV